MLGIMAAIQLRAELFREMSPLLDNESAMVKLIKYVRKLSGKKTDPTLMTEEEFFAKVDKSLEQATSLPSRRRECHPIHPYER